MNTKKEPKTVRQKKFFKNVSEGMTTRQAAIKAGYNEASAHVSASQNIKNYQDYWSKMLDKAGCSDEVICQTIAEGLKATKVIGYLHSVNKDQDGQMHKIKPDEVVANEFVEVPDYPTRAKFVDIALKLKNAYPANKHEVAGKDGGPLEVNIVYADS